MDCRHTESKISKYLDTGCTVGEIESLNSHPITCKAREGLMTDSAFVKKILVHLAFVTPREDFLATILSRLDCLDNDPEEYFISGIGM